MERGGKRTGRGRPRRIDQEMVNQPDVVHSPYPFQTNGKKRGRPRLTLQERLRKTPRQTLDSTDDDDSNPFPENSRKRGRPITRAEDDKLNSTSSKEYAFPILSTAKTIDTRAAQTEPSKRRRPITLSSSSSKELSTDSGDEDYSPSFPETTGRNRGRPRTTPQQAVNATGPRHHVEESCVIALPACNHPLPSNLVMSAAGKNVNSSHHVQDSGVEKVNSSCHLAPIVPMDSCVNDGYKIHLPQTQALVVAKDARTTTCQSFNLTEAVDRIHNTLHDDDGEDIESDIDPSLVDVKRYRVKPEIAPLLDQIFEKHGDIVKNCKVKGLQGCYLEKVCSIYEKLQNSSFQEIKRGELSEMGKVLDGLEEAGLNVKWLSKRVYDILDVRVFLKVYDQCRKEFNEGNDRLIALENEAALIRERMSGLETKISEMKGEKEKAKKTHNLLNSSLVDGLLI